jgi:hypothetical protein
LVVVVAHWGCCWVRWNQTHWPQKKKTLCRVRVLLSYGYSSRGCGIRDCYSLLGVPIRRSINCEK